MKKILTVLICFVMLFCITSCGSSSQEISTVSTTTSATTSAPKPKVKFYQGTRFPTLESISIYGIECTGEVGENAFLYGTYENRMDIQADIAYYVEFVEEEYGYTCEYLPADEDSVKVRITADQGTLIFNAGLASGVVICAYTWNH